MSNEPSVKEQIARLKAAIELKKKSQQQPVSVNVSNPAYRPPQHSNRYSYNAYPSVPTSAAFRNRSLVVNHSDPPAQPLTTTQTSIPVSKSKNKSLVVNAATDASVSSTVEGSADLPKFITKGNKLIRAGVVVKKIPDINETSGGITKVFNKPTTAKTFTIADGKRQILINGIEFKVDPTRRKLIRVQATALPERSTSVPQLAPPRVRIPKRVTIGSQSFILSKTGNLIPQKTQCTHYQMGSCKLAHKCPFLHDPLQRCICRKYLSNVGCPKGTSCSLSHVPTVHNTPVCLHYMTKKGCTNFGCKYLHVVVKDVNESICVAFARKGYCGKVGCTLRHVWQCPDVDAGKACSFGKKCRLAPCILERKGIDVGNLYKRKDVDRSVSTEESTEDSGEVLLKKPNFVSGFNPRSTYDPNDLAVNMEDSGDEHEEQSDEEEEPDDDVDDDHEQEDSEVAGNNEFGDDMVELDWGDADE
ncbi:hypothetical protein BDR26DRAFT_930097 [Obelidium mucronatum]|nr:hypothetical protein BDR26DRAFT_930097 [Obelidium mucronatum]